MFYRLALIILAWGISLGFFIGVVLGMSSILVFPTAHIN